MAYKLNYFFGPRVSAQHQQNLQGLTEGVHKLSTMQPFSESVGGGYEGLIVDFKSGLRLQIPAGNWHVKISDYKSKVIFVDKDTSEEVLISAEKYFIQWEIILHRDGKQVFYHRLDPKGKKVHFQFFPTGMGDHISLFPYIETFRRIYDCQASVTVAPYLQELIKLYYPKVECRDNPPEDSYAIYYLSPTFHPFLTSEEIRTVPMTQFGRELLDIGQADKVVYRPNKPRQIMEPYVCIAVQSSGTIKTWLNPTGWDQVVAYLKKIGYWVLCIDQKSEQTGYGMTVCKPKEAEDFTGDIPLSERVNLLAYADFFIGLSSGLSWLAWAVDIPVILISGITAPWFEFSTPYRIYNRLVCHGCHNWDKIPWPSFEKCPVFGGTERAYECSKKISAQQVIDAIDSIRNKQFVE